jgi:hypothetical protein
LLRQVAKVLQFLPFHVRKRASLSCFLEEMKQVERAIWNSAAT